MNTELKALLKLVLDLYNVGADALSKANFVTVLLPALYQLAADVPGAVSNMGDLKAEIAALPGSQQEADLLAYITSSFASIDSNAKAQAALAAALKMLVDVADDAEALAAALKA